MQEIFQETKIAKNEALASDARLFDVINEKCKEMAGDAQMVFGERETLIIPLKLHKTNDIGGKLKDLHANMAKGTLFIGTFFGLSNLRALFELLAEEDIKACGQALNRSLPLVEIKTVGMLLSKAGFSQITVISEQIDFSFKNLKEALYFIKNSGESNCLVKRDYGLLSGTILKKTLEKYQNSVILSFDVCFFSCIK